MDAKHSDLTTKNKIMEEATKLFAEKGLEGTSTRDIAKATGSNVSLISYYFGGKEGLYKAIIKEFAEQAQSRMENILKNYEGQSLEPSSFVARLREIISGFVSMKIMNPDMSLLLQREALSGLPFAFEIYDEIFSSVGEKIVSIYKQGQQKGFVKKDIHPYVCFFSLVHSVDFYMTANRCNTEFIKQCPRFPEGKDLFVDQLVKIFVEGVLK